MKTAFTLVLVVGMCPAAWAVNKCKGPDGKVVYQDHPCEGAEKVNLTGAGQAAPNSPSADAWKSDAARQAKYQRAMEAISKNQVFVGMSAEHVVMSWGQPTTINDSVGSYGRHAQWVYRAGVARGQYVYIQNGVVTSVQTQN